jgi:hypothetical protein
VSALFSAATFLKFERDAAGAISLPLLQQYLARRVANARLVSLPVYCVANVSAGSEA